MTRPSASDVSDDHVNHDPYPIGRSHSLKTWPEFFHKIATGEKSWELRKNDRDYRVGDKLWLHEWDPKTKDYCGGALLVEVTYVAKNLSAFGLPDDCVIMSIRTLKPEVVT